MAKKRPYHRTDRLNRQVAEVLARAIQRETREEVLRMAIVTGVEVTRDLSVARVYYQTMGGDQAEIAEAFERAAGFLRCRVGDQVRMRQTPELRFQYDESIDRGRRVEELLAGMPELKSDAVDGEVEGS
ncbi:MAG: 30S ribosome-binding factor RbfA [Myxococcota bacterium]|nr:30S ribosome-binding factor RbfA [Myxococcota bacterium]